MNLSSDPQSVVAHLPHLPGVYRMIDSAGQVIYVGKALDLKKRVASYFQKTAALSPRVCLMVSQVRDVQTTVTRSEAEALLLENNLIKTLSPKYNILFRDDKSYPYIVLTEEPIPRLGFHRGALEKPHRYFGPFPGAGAVRESLQLLQRVFRLRTCEDSVFRNRSRPCLLYQIRRCSGPCVGKVDEARYREDVRNAELFLRGKDDQVVHRLVERMESAAARMEYEAAAGYRDQIGALRKVRETQFVSREGPLDADVIACVAEHGRVCVDWVMIRGGLHLGDKSYFPKNAGEGDVTVALEAFLTQHYLTCSPPPLIVIGESLATAGLAQVLSEQAGRRVEIIHDRTPERRAWLKMAEQNARLALGRRQALLAGQEGLLQALAEALQLPDSTARIECFDVSHTGGEATVAACVVYDGGAMRNGEYRRYNIGAAGAGDDYGALREAFTRRYGKIVAEEGKRPDLILVDGGRGQVSVAEKVLADLGLADIPLLGVAKGESRKPGLEQLVFPDRREPLRLPPEHPGLHLIQQIRDEAHRFAVQGHRARRGKTRNRSLLEDIPGIGPQRRRKLLARFGGLKGLVSASQDELAKVEGVSRALAEKIYQALH